MPQPKGCDGHKVLTSTVELVGLAVLIVYTFISFLQWLQIRSANRLTREALNDNGRSLQQTLDKMQGQIEVATRLYDEAKEQTA